MNAMKEAPPLRRVKEGYTTGARTLISFSTPKTASSNDRFSTVSRSGPGGGPLRARPPKGLPPKKLDAQDPAIRRTAAYVLGALKDPRAIHALKIALNDSSEDVRWNAAMALAQLNDASGSELLTKLLDRNYVDKLEGMTPEQKSQLVINAVKCLGLLKFQPAKDKIFMLSQSDPDLAVRDASLEALKKF